MKPYDTMTDEEAEAEAQRIAARLGVAPEAVRPWLDQRRAGLQGGDVAELDITPHE